MPYRNDSLTGTADINMENCGPYKARLQETYRVPKAEGPPSEYDNGREASQLELRVNDIDHLIKHLAKANGRIAKALDRAGGAMPEAKKEGMAAPLEPGLLGNLRTGLATIEHLIHETDELANRAEDLIG